MRRLPAAALAVFLTGFCPAEAMELDQFLAECPKSVIGMDETQSELYCKCLWAAVTDLDAPGADPDLGLEMLAWNLDKGFGAIPTFPEEKQQAATTMFEYINEIMPICLQGAVTGQVNPDGSLR